jgi:membrane-associated phospholipid phosphatase
MSSAATQVSRPSTSELVEGVLFYPIALVISATVCPGLTLCIPGLVFVAVVIPLVAVTIVALLAAAVVAAPFLLVRGVRGLRARRSESRRRPRVLEPVKI